jgi:outer membrane protein assembly factor BamB
VPRTRRRVGIGVAVAVLLTVGFAAPARGATRPVTAWRSPTLDGIVQGRPVVVGDVVVVATENNSIYGLALRDGHLLWGPRHIGPPVPLATIASLAPAAKGCGDLDPLGITSAPAVDTTTNPPRVFAVAEVLPTVGRRVPVHELVGVEATTGQVVVGPTPIDPPTMIHPELEQQRAGLAIANGNVYVGFGGLYGDCGDYHGFVVAARTDGSGLAGSFELANATATNREAAVWSTAPPVIDAAGDVYVATGNADGSPPDPQTDYSDAVVRFAPNLGTPLDYFQPPSWRSDNAADGDLGSTAPVLLGSQVFEVGKQQVAFLLDAASLGGADHHAALSSLESCAAYGTNAALGSSVYVACRSGVGQIIVDRSTNPPRLRAGWTTSASANGPITIGAGLVWSVDLSGQMLDGLDPVTGRLVVHHAVTLDSSQHFPTATVAPGWVLVESADHVAAFTLARTTTKRR